MFTIHPTRILLLLILAISTAVHGADFTPVKLHTEHLENPLAIGTTTPRFSWQLAPTDPSVRNLKQTAYEIQVASSTEKFTESDLWSTGKVDSPATSLIPYSGKQIKSRSQAVWRVRSWGTTGQASAWSQPATFAVGLLQPADWQAQWIAAADNPTRKTKENIQNFKGDKKRGEIIVTPAKHFRKEFKSKKKPVRALLHATSLGVHTLELNGKAVGDWFLAPGWTSYSKRLHSLTYDVTGDIREGANVLGATLADGWYAGYTAYGLLTGVAGVEKGVNGRWYYGKTPALKLQLEIEFDDGSRQVVATDHSWHSALSPHTEADILMGESYDARRELNGWSSPGFGASTWQPVAAHPGTPGKIEPHPGVPVRKIEEITPVAVTEHKPGVWIFNLGQNISGIVRLKVKGKAGDKVTIRYAEVLHADGRLSTENLRCARSVDTYTLRGDARGETWEPCFTSHGFQYVELTGFPGKPGKDSVTGIVIHSDTPLTGSFKCSDPMLNRLYQNIVWTQRANFCDVPTDCPQRDERMGWTGDAQIYVRAATCNADISAFYTKWLRDLNDDQWDHGPYPNFAPTPFIRKKMHFAAAWGDAGIICPWTIWQVYGDTRVIAEHWPKMEKFMEFRRSRDPGFKGTADKDCAFGDWLAIYKPKTPIPFIDLAYHAHGARLMAEMARAIGKKDRADHYSRRAEQLRKRFAELHVNADGTLKIANQSTYAMSLSFGLIPKALEARAADQLAKLIRANGNKMTTGFLGTRPLLPALSATGHHDLAGILMQQKQYPSWGYEVENGATTIWERWNSFIKGKGVHNPAMNSFSHYAFGAVCEWMFAELGGIDLLQPGYDLIKIAPRPTGTITHCSVATETRHGKLSCSWKLDGNQFHTEFTIPPNTEAVVTLPIAGPGGQPRRIGSGTHKMFGKYRAR